MPAPLTLSSLKGEHCPAVLLEVAVLTQRFELNVPEETRPNNVAITFDAETQTATITATLPIFYNLDDGGNVVVSAIDYLP